MPSDRSSDLELKIIRAIAVLLFAVPIVSARAQARSEANCSYESCALGIAPVWNGLAITRGERQQHAGTLGFFFPGDVTSVFEGNDAAVDAARDAMRTRTIAAALTDAGIVLIGSGLARAAFQRHFDGFSQVLAISGAASLAASVPLQFTADGLLSRAVWLYNRKYGR
jgi:hypothetical protein